MTKNTPSGKRPVYKENEKPADRRNAFASRRFGGRLIGTFMADITRPAFKRKSPLLVRLVMDWDILVGPELAGRSVPRRLRPGVLSVGCAGPVAMEMRYAAPQILERINTACGLYGEYRLRELKLMQDVTISPPSLPQARPAPLSVTIEGLEEGPLREALERLGGHIAARRPASGRK